MYEKKLWKIEELWRKYFYAAPTSSSFVSANLPAGEEGAGIQSLSKNTHLSESKGSNVCPANDINLADINIENNSPFGFSFKEQNKCHPVLNPHSLIPAKAGISILKKFYKDNISIYNPDFQMVSKFNFEASEKTVHDDEYGKYLGLKYSQVLEKNGKLIYLFDNHNKIIQPFLEYAELLGKGFDVVHIDAHDDDAVFVGQKSQNLELGKAQEYIAQTRISDFFDFLSEVTISVFSSVIPAKAGIQDSSKNTLDSRPSLAGRQVRGNDKLEYKLIQNIHRYTKSTDFQEFKKPKNPYILSLDIDIFGPEGDFTDLESKIEIIASAWQHAGVICIAMSPGFIDQEYAQGIIEIFVKK